MSEAQNTPDSLPDAQVTEGRGGPAIQERPFWSKVMAGKELINKIRKIYQNGWCAWCTIRCGIKRKYAQPCKRREKT